MTANPQFDAVAEFNTTSGHAVRNEPSLDYNDIELRHNVFLEEVEEIGLALIEYKSAYHEYKFGEGYENGEVYIERMNTAKVEFLDGLADTLVTLYGLAQATGMPITEAFDAVHKSNMSKLGEDGKPIYFTDGPKKGKIAKGPNYRPPTDDLRALLEA